MCLCMCVRASRTQPHAAYAAYTHGLSSRWNYLLRVTDWEALSSSDLLQPLETAIQSHFIPALTGQTPPGTSVREMLAFPARLGGLGLINPVAIAQEQHASSQLISAPLVERVLHQDHQLANCQSAQQDIKPKVRSDKRVNRRRMPGICNANCQFPCNVLWSSLKRKEHQPG